jgi:hypothetical protein
VKSVASVWGDKTLPRIAIPPKGGLRVRLPYSQSNRDWLRIGQRKPVWNKANRYWEIPRSHLNRIAKHALEAFGQCWIIQSISRLEVCAPACWNASGLDCECACHGENHGSENDDSWFVVCESFACRSAGVDYSIRLIGARRRTPTDAELRSAGGVRWSTYVIRQPGSNLVKIGKATDVNARLKTLQTGMPDEIEILSVINGDHESYLHKRHAAERVRGEWFRLTTEVRDSISHLERSTR